MKAEVKYWEYDDVEDKHNLYYIEFYDPELIATIEKDSDGDYFCDIKDEFCNDYEYLSATTIEDAKKEVEELITYSLTNKIDDLRDLIEHLKVVVEDFKGEKNETSLNREYI